MAYKVNLISLGCAKNLINSEQMLCLLDEAGVEILNTPEGADVVILDGFIDSAKMEAIDNIDLSRRAQKSWPFEKNNRCRLLDRAVQK
ncbi:MAG: hypothetical protein V8S95_03515 [Odoribacter sp.]